jgi:hypothetical protein
MRRRKNNLHPERLHYTGLFLPVISALLLFVFACKSSPETESLVFEAEAPAVEENVPSGEDIQGRTDDEPALVIPPESPVSETDAMDMAEEPVLDLPETVVPDIPPAEPQQNPAILPLPAAPNLAPPEPPLSEPPAVGESPPALPSLQPAIPDKPPEPEEKPPAPPPETPVLRPLEPAAPAPVREPVPTPVAPLPDLPVLTPPSAADEEIVFSRTVRATAGQLVEIPFRGAGWVYLGEFGSRQGIAYDSRRLDPEGQTFVFRAEQAGTYALKFYRQDFIRDYILNDYVQVIVGEAPDASGIGWFNPPMERGRVVAEPRWPPIEGATGPAQASAAEPPLPSVNLSPETESPAAVSDTDISTPAEAAFSPSALPETSVPEEAPFGEEPGEYVRRARDEYDAGRAASALSILDQFKERYPSGTDEAWWLYGQLFEANSPNRNIRLALDYYRRLVSEYPQSPRVPEARRRIAYLERYYFNLR